MRNAYFLISLAVLVAFGGGLFYSVKLFRDSFESGIGAQVHLKLVDIDLASRPPLRTDEKQIQLIFVGDVMLSRKIGEIMAREGDFRYPFLNVASELSRADIAFGNLEGPISSRGENQGSEYSFRADPRVVEGLAYAGFDVLSLANNHIWDYGSDALLDTVDILRANRIHPVGAGKNAEEANAPAILTIRGTPISFFAYTNLYPKGLSAKGGSVPDRQAGASGGEAQHPGVNAFDLVRAQGEIREIKKSGGADIVIVSFHWGEEYITRANDTQREIAYALVDAGADLVVGHHPHVVQEVERYRNAWIAYSLGNFVFDQNFSDDTSRGLALSVAVRGKRIERVAEIPVLFLPSYQPNIQERGKP